MSLMLVFKLLFICLVTFFNTEEAKGRSKVALASVDSKSLKSLDSFCSMVKKYVSAVFGETFLWL